MKNKISFLVMLTVALGANCAKASECVGEECELTPIVITDNINVDEVLSPTKYEINWTDSDTENQTYCSYDYNCPFESAEECEVWYKKPVHKTYLEPRAPHINSALVMDMLYSINSTYNISANDETMKPLLSRYQMLMKASQSCCMTGILYKMNEKNLSDTNVYNFLKDDANHFAITQRCMVTPDEEIRHSYSNGVNGEMVADVRNSCLCKNREWFTNLLQPFKDIYEQAPQFEDEEFIYTYTDGMQREINVSINADVQTALGLLSVCPD